MDLCVSSHFVVFNHSLRTYNELHYNFLFWVKKAYKKEADSRGDSCITVSESNVSLIHHHGPRGRAVSVLARHLHVENDPVDKA